MVRRKAWQPTASQDDEAQVLDECTARVRELGVGAAIRQRRTASIVDSVTRRA
jgi:hypothetical protein